MDHRSQDYKEKKPGSREKLGLALPGPDRNCDSYTGQDLVNLGWVPEFSPKVDAPALLGRSAKGVSRGQVTEAQADHKDCKCRRQIIQ